MHIENLAVKPLLVEQYERLSVTAYNSQIVAQFAPRDEGDLVRDCSQTSHIEMSTTPTDSLPWAAGSGYLSVQNVVARKGSHKPDKLTMYSSLDILDDDGSGAGSLIDDDSSDGQDAGVSREVSPNPNDTGQQSSGKMLDSNKGRKRDLSLIHEHSLRGDLALLNKMDSSHRRNHSL